MRLVLEEVFRDAFDEEEKPIKIKIGEIVVYTEDLTPERLLAMKNDTDDIMGYKKYREVLKKEGFDIE